MTVKNFKELINSIPSEFDSGTIGFGTGVDWWDLVPFLSIGKEQITADFFDEEIAEVFDVVVYLDDKDEDEDDEEE